MIASPAMAESVINSFHKKYEIVTETGCWIWMASHHARGYGLIHTGRDLRAGKMEFAHRVSYEIHYGPFDQSLSVLHRCDNPWCVNPNHLFLGSHQDNMRDMSNKRRNVNQTKKLTKEQVEEIRKTPHSISTKTLALYYGISEGHMSRVRRGLSSHY